MNRLNKSSKQISKKRVLSFFIILLIACLIIITITLRYYMQFGKISNPETIIIEKIRVVDDTLYIKGTHEKSYLFFRGPNYDIENNKLFLRLNFTLKPKFNPYYDDKMDNLSKDFNFSISHPEKKMINEVYLQGQDSQKTKLIWSR